MKRLSLSTIFLSLLSLFLSVGVYAQDVSMNSSTDVGTASINDIVTFTVVVNNDGHTDITGLTVVDMVPNGSVFSSVNAPMGTTYDEGTGVWNIGSALTAGTNSLQLILSVQAVSEGVIFNMAEVQTMNEVDVDSSPNNGNWLEDDITTTCSTVPVSFCGIGGDTVTLTAVAGLNNYQWFFDDGTGPAAIVGETNSTFDATHEGTYTYTAEVAGSTCSLGQCCGTILIESCGSIGDFVWDDTNHDGIQDAGEVGLSGVTVYLYDGNGTQIATTITSGTGAYNFPNLPAGDYQVKFDTPAGYTLSPQNAGADDADSDVDAAGFTQVVSLGVGENNSTLDMGVYQPAGASLGNFVWLDTNHDGIQDAGEPGIEGVVVNLKDNTGTIIATTTTDATGGYSFTGLAAGDYSVQFVSPTGYGSVPTGAGAGDVDSDGDPATGETGTITLVAGENNTNVDMGYTLGSIGNFVWNDTNQDGIQNGVEAGIGGVTVYLYDGTGTQIATTTTSPSGIYNFPNLPAGDYQVKFDTPAGYTLSPQNAGADDADSDVDATGFTQVITLGAGENNPTLDMGVFQPAGASIGNFVWLDTNHDGIQDAGEPGIEGVVVNLKDNTGAIIATTTTDATGGYSFTGLAAGDYSVQFVSPTGYGSVPTGAGAGDVDSDGDPATGETGTITLADGENNTNVDMGYTLGSIGNYVWNDTNQDGIQNGAEAGIGGVTVYLYDGTGTQIATTTTSPSGIYNFPNLPAGDYQVKFDTPAGYTLSPQNAGADDADSDVDASGFTQVITLGAGENNPTLDMGVFQPAGASIGNFVWLDTNHDGIQDAGEPGIEGVVVNLKDNTGTIIATTTTDATGGYSFTGLAAGDYSVQFVSPTGYGSVPTGAGAGDVDSDGDPATGETGTITLADGENNTNVDMGYTLGSIGNYVWNDTNQDGIQDAGEVGIGGVTVYLYDGTGTQIATTTTSPSGIYNFPNLPAGDYQVKFDTPAGYALSPQNAGADDADSDVDATGFTQVVTLGAGENNPTLDMGVYSQGTGTIGDYVWNDVNEDGIQDANEQGIGGIVVNLLDSNGAIIATTTTNTNGGYFFNNLPAGDYQVQFIVPSGNTVSPQTNGTVDGSDADATGLTATITLAEGESNTSIDMGLFGCVCEDIVGVDTMTFQSSDQDIAACVPLALTTAQLYDIILNGLPYNNGLAACGQDSLVYYSFFGAGGGTNGPYMLDFWNVGGSSFSGAFADITALADSMNLWDPTGDWLAANGVISGGLENSSIYGTMQVTTTATGQETTINQNYTNVMTGSEVTVPGTPGVNTIVFVDPDNTCCTDTVIVVVEGDIALGSIGNYVWLDDNADGIQDAGETGLGGITVELLDASGAVVATTTTDNSGFYSFTDLVAGNYKVHIELAGQSVSPQGAGGDGSLDNDIDAAGYSGVITLTAGENNMDVDAGLLPCAGCTDLIAVDTLTYQASTEDIAVCMPLALTTAELYDIVLNGLPYNNGLTACGEDSLVYYSFFGAGGGTNGPYNLDFWTVGGGTYSGAFADITALADSMNVWDPNGTWIASGGVVSGGMWNPGIYGTMQVTTTATGQETTINQNYTSVMSGSKVTVPGTPGVNTVVYIDPNNTCCRDTVIVIVEGTNHLFAKNDANQTEMNFAVSGHVLTNDNDPEGNNLSVNTVLVTEPSHGDVIMNADGSYVYVPNPNYTGHDVFEYQVCDDGVPQVCDTARVDITIFGTADENNNPPVGVADHGITNAGSPLVGSLLSNDSDPDGDNLTINTTPITDPSNGTLVINPDGTYTYTPNPGFEGEDEFSYQICDDGTPVLCDTVIVTIDVLNPVQNVTYANDDAGTGEINQPIVGSLTANDNDPEGNTQTVNTTPVTTPMHGAVVINPDGSYTYTPNEDFVGNDFFLYATCDDGTPQACDTATVYLSIMSENTVIAKNDINQTLVNVSVTGSVVTNDDDPQGDSFLVDPILIDQPDHGTVTINAEGIYTYVPDTDFAGEDFFTYRICDNGMPQACDTADVYIDIIAIDTTVNNPPIGVIDNGITLVDVPLGGHISTNDGDPDGDTVTVVTTPIIPPSNGTVVIQPDGSYVYTPNPGYIGLDTFYYAVCDNAIPPLCDTAMVILEVLPDNGENIVFANDDAGFGQMNDVILGSMILNDFDPQGDGFGVSIIPISDPSNGTVVLNADGTYAYSPSLDYFGNDEFVYAICDDGVPQACDTATVYLTIFPGSPVSPDVVAVDDIDTTYKDTPIVIDIYENDNIPTDVYGVNIIVNPSHGTVNVDSSGVVTYTPTPGYCSDVPDEFQYELCANNVCDTALVQIYVLCPDISIVSGFSPNGDGINENFIIKGIEDYPKNKLKIYNRWGNLVFEKEPYDNSWNGSWIQDAAPVPDGTYFYIWDNGEGERFSGYIEVHR